MSLPVGVSVVIPVKETRWAKTRLGLVEGDRRRVALHLATATIRAALDSSTVARTLVVTSDEAVGAIAATLGAVVVEEDGVSGLNPAAELGRTHALVHRPHAPVAILVADLPLLRPAHLDHLVREFRARSVPLHVADHRGAGTTALIHGPHVSPAVAFGGSSSSAHTRNGFAPARDAMLGLRTDLDDREDLARHRVARRVSCCHA